MMAKKNYDLTEITRLLLKLRDNCVPKGGDAYEDPERAEKYDALNAAIFLINNPSTSKEWISLKDRLPPIKGKMVLVVNGHSSIDILGLWENHGNRWKWISKTGVFRHYNDITHWMPLPEPPKEE